MGRRKKMNPGEIVKRAVQDISGIKNTTIANIATEGEEPDIIAAVIVDIAKDEKELIKLIATAIYMYSREVN